MPRLASGRETPALSYIGRSAEDLLRRPLLSGDTDRLADGGLGGKNKVVEADETYVGGKPPPGEDRRSRSLRTGQQRMHKALYSVRLVGNLSHPDYNWRSEDVEQMPRALLNEIDRTFKRFAPS